MNAHSVWSTARQLALASALCAAACSSNPQPARAPAKTVAVPEEHLFFVDTPIGKLHVSDGGSGAGVPVLFVHGLGGDIDTWRSQLDHIRGFRRAIAFEARGHGQSARTTEAGYTVDGLADDIDAVAQALKLSRFVLVGHSIAGCALQLYAAKHPETLAGLVFAEGIGSFKHAGPPATLEEWIKADAAMQADPAKLAQDYAPMLRPARPATKDKVLKSLAEMDPKAFAPLRASMFRFAQPQDLSKTSLAVFSIEADANHEPVRFSVSDPTAPVLTLLSVSHWEMLDDPDGFNHALDGFLSGH